MPISYGGHPLLLDDPDGRLQSLLDAVQPLDATRLFALDTQARVSGMRNHRGKQAAGRGLPIPNYPPPPPPRLNVLWWPTGASRWATFLGLVDEPTLEKIAAAYRTSVGNSSSAVGADPARELKISDGTTELKIPMYMLTPRRVTASADGDALWILPLVDVRYYWQFRHAGSNATPPTFDDMIEDIAEALGETITSDGAAEAYERPDVAEMMRRHENAGLMLDAICHSSGMRFVRNLNDAGNVVNRTMTWDSSLLDLSSNQTDYQQMAGGPAQDRMDFRLPVPEKVRVCFRFYRDGLVQDMLWDHRASPNIAEDDVFTVDVNLADTPNFDTQRGTHGGLVKVVHSTWFARMNYSTTERTEPTNLSDLEALAAQIAADYHDSLFTNYDYTFAGIKKWKLTSYDDALEIRICPLGPNGDYECYTRVQSAPHNFGVEVNCSQNGNEEYPVFDGPVLAKAGAITKRPESGDTDRYGTGTASIWWRGPNVDPDPGVTGVLPEDTEIVVRVFHVGEEDISSGQYVILVPIAGQWVVAQAKDWMYIEPEPMP